MVKHFTNIFLNLTIALRSWENFKEAESKEEKEKLHSVLIFYPWRLRGCSRTYFLAFQLREAASIVGLWPLSSIFKAS